MDPLIRLSVENLAVERGGRELFRALSLLCEAGEAVALTGPNGAGKTSLLRAIAGFVRPSTGAIRFKSAAGPIEADEARRAQCHLIGHLDGLSDSRTARAELIFAAGWTGANPAAALAGAGRLGLGRVLDLDVRRLSAGQRRRLALARLMAAPRALWLLDEPLSPVDTAGRALLGEVMADHLARGGLIIAAVHDPLPIPARTLAIGG